MLGVPAAAPGCQDDERAERSVEGGRRRKRGSDNAGGTLSWLPVAVLPASVGDFHAVHLRVDLMVTYGDTLAGCASRRVPPFLLILGGVC